MASGHMRPIRALMIAVAAIAIAAAVVLLVVLLPSLTPHFGFPSQAQASHDLGSSATMSKTYTAHGYYTANGLYVKKAEAVYYNSSSAISVVNEIQLNSSKDAASYDGTLSSLYMRLLGINATYFSYDMVNVTMFSMAESTLIELYVFTFHEGSFAYSCIITATSPPASFSAKGFAEAVVGSVVYAV